MPDNTTPPQPRDGLAQIVFACAVPWIVMLVQFLVMPDYIGSLLKSDVGKVVTGIVFLWETAGCWFFLPRTPAIFTSDDGWSWTTTTRLKVVVLVFVLPAALLILFGPAFATVFDVGPK